jgi:hypothetical protein
MLVNRAKPSAVKLSLVTIQVRMYASESTVVDVIAAAPVLPRLRFNIAKHVQACRPPVALRTDSSGRKAQD